VKVEEWTKSHAREVARWRAYATIRWSPATFRLFVAAWNERAIRLYKRLAFREVAREMRRFERLGEHEFLRMEQSA
jgi:ribosomal protein S18 acetylase RimI-like enzyme